MYWYSRFLFERALAATYLVAFLCAANQFVPLLGERGLEPAPRFTQFVSFRASPSLFYLSPTDTAFRVGAWIGVGLAILALTSWPQQRGTIAAAAVWAAMWVLYLSYVNVGQTFYGFGWETLLLESGFLAIFLGGWTTTPSPWIQWMYRWLVFRLMFGAALITMAFQGVLILSGNLSWLNWLTVVLCIPVLDDRLVSWLPLTASALHEPQMAHRYAIYALAAAVTLLSIAPTMNMLSSAQVMNTSFEPLHLVNTYGAFGSVTKERYEIVIEGTDAAAITPETKWREYEFKAKPGDPARLPPQIAPYHLRLDWLMWFEAFSPQPHSQWFIAFLQRLLQGDTQTLSLMRTNPFPGSPPRFLRARYYRYRFTTPAERRASGLWWNRQLVSEFVPPITLSSFASQ